jgi:hypothetical protein
VDRNERLKTSHALTCPGSTQVLLTRSGDVIGAAHILRILDELHGFTHDPC